MCNRHRKNPDVVQTEEQQLCLVSTMLQPSFERQVPQQTIPFPVVVNVLEVCHSSWPIHSEDRRKHRRMVEYDLYVQSIRTHARKIFRRSLIHQIRQYIGYVARRLQQNVFPSIFPCPKLVTLPIFPSFRTVWSTQSTRLILFEPSRVQKHFNRLHIIFSRKRRRTTTI